jgi:hypothetical protein
MTYRLLYILLLLAIIIFGIYYYLDIQEKHTNELKRVEILERKNNQKNYVINQARLNTSPCSIPDLNSPKECYIDSNYECKWSVEADRCNLTDQ